MTDEIEVESDNTEIETEGGEPEIKGARAAIREAMRIHSADSEATASSDKGETEKPADGPARAPDGKFTSTKIQGEIPVNTGMPPLGTAPAQTLPPISPPPSWKDKAKEVFNSLSREAQEIVLEREKERDDGVNRKLYQISQKEQVWNGIERTAESIAQRYPGTKPQQVIEAAVAGQNILDANPKAGIAWMLKSYGLTPQDLLDSQGQLVTPQAVDPIYAQRVESLEQKIAAQEQAANEARFQQLVGEVRAFSEERGADGQPLRPHFEKVSTLMKPIVTELQATNPTMPIRAILDRAYDQAVYAHPETREALIQAKLASELAKRQAEAKAQADQARRVSVGLKGSAGGPVGKTATKGARNAIMRAMEIHRPQ